MPALTINTNMMALTAANNLTRTYSALAKSLNKLSSGMRINSAADDAAGLAIRELLRSDIAALNQGVRNANDAISMLQVMDGAAQVIDEKLIRMKELAEQSSTGTYSDKQRQIMEEEFKAMRDEIDRIARATNFNGVRLLDGTSVNLMPIPGTGSGASAAYGLKIHFGTGNSSAEDYYYVQGKDFTSSGLGIADLTIATQHSAQAALDVLYDAILTKDMGRAHFGSMMNRFENTVTNLTIQSENLQAAESRISDVDVAFEMTVFMNAQIRAQAAVAMLSQANMMPQLALTLLQGA